MNQHPLLDHHRYIDKMFPTPLVGVSLSPSDPSILCKLEFFNPARSIKDRIARYILEKAWRTRKIKVGSTVIEASSGSTSIALALVCAQMGLKFIAIMPEGVSQERELIIRSFGAEVIYCPHCDGMQGCLDFAEQEARKRNAFYPRQFENPDNAETHHLWTGQEIISQLPEGVIDAVVSGVGTGGTIIGLTRAFKEAGCKSIPYIAIPTTSHAVGDVECSSFSKRIPGVVECMSKLYDKKKLPEAIEISIPDTLAIETTRRLIALGFPVGPSSGLNYAASLLVAKQLGKNAQIVTVFPDGMEKYFSTELFDPFRTSPAL